jgi:hypothetical protein
MAKKYVINDNRLVLGQVNYHEELCRDNSKTIGGGSWHIEGNKLYLYGISMNFGSVEKEDVDKAYKSPSIEKMEIVFSHELNLSKILNNHTT